VIGYVTLGTNNFEKAVAFYDELLGMLGGKRLFEMDRAVAWQAGEDSPAVSVCKPHDGKPASVGNGTMVALVAPSPEQVQAIYAKALELGGTDEGPPGQRMPQFFGAYFRDLDGNKLCAFCMTAEGAA
jgi:catechol 2,3-dioxygenase-like lactoylglutathione lyase family enzyme